MFQPDNDGVYAKVYASQGRRYFACGVLYLLGATLIYTALAHPPAAHWIVFLMVVGAAILWLAEILRRASRLGILLTADDLRDTSGNLLARMDEIRLVDRGALAIKPANGFTLVLNTRHPRSWVPGMWWRFGKRVGVGGVTAAGPAKFMAEQIALRIYERDR